MKELLEQSVDLERHAGKQKLLNGRNDEKEIQWTQDERIGQHPMQMLRSGLDRFIDYVMQQQNLHQPYYRYSFARTLG
ncbi:hypothetical protein KIN20_024916 [Parelaphostrongylus tenuis]|uniref:Uncharacterized protein n=1 Tax=Parelaphostrongylus tenuis TaxID=148309 RepID=A0AAD5MU97_PARTN|nr:hypothetical protein KIN20_024916 [Parelaphostrongylus tenuis]